LVTRGSGGERSQIRVVRRGWWGRMKNEFLAKKEVVVSSLKFGWWVGVGGKV